MNIISKLLREDLSEFSPILEKKYSLFHFFKKKERRIIQLQLKKEFNPFEDVKITLFDNTIRAVEYKTVKLDKSVIKELLNYTIDNLNNDFNGSGKFDSQDEYHLVNELSITRFWSFNEKTDAYNLTFTTFENSVFFQIVNFQNYLKS